MTLFTPTSKWQLEEHELFTDSVKKFFTDEVKPNLEEWGKKQQVDRASVSYTHLRAHET